MLQNLAYQRASEVGRLRTEQRQRPPEPKISDALRDDCYDPLEQADFPCALLDVPVFTRVASGAGQPLFHITTKTGADAKGRPTDEGFIALAGSVCAEGLRDSAPTYVPQTRERLLADGDLVRQGQVLAFARDHAFDSPNGAAAIIVGGAANGWNAWTSTDGRCLHDVVRGRGRFAVPVTAVPAAGMVCATKWGIGCTNFTSRARW